MTRVERRRDQITRDRRAEGGRETTAATLALVTAAITAAAVVAVATAAAAAAAAAITTATAILSVTRNSEVVGSTSDEATGVLTWLLRTCSTAHSDCSKLGDEKYVTELAR